MFNSMSSTSLVTMGPATAALERSTKRRRLSETEKSDSSNNCASFQLGAMFNDIHNDEEDAFPSIGWNFDDDDEPTDTASPSSVSIQTTSCELSSSFKSLSGSKRQSPGGMVRSKAFCGLDTMIPPPQKTSDPFQLESISEALPSALKSSKLDRNMYILSSSCLPPRRKHVGPSYFASTQRMRA